jgi:hypothetical protein
LNYKSYENVLLLAVEDLFPWQQVMNENMLVCVMQRRHSELLLGNISFLFSYPLSVGRTSDSPTTPELFSSPSQVMRSQTQFWVRMQPQNLWN